MKDLDGKIALVTGGGRGLGAACGHALAKRGAKVLLADVNFEGATAKAAEYVAEGLSAVALQLDVSDRAACDRLAPQVEAAHGPLSILVNNAGIVRYAKLGEPDSPQYWDQSINVNLTGVFNATTAFLPQLKATRGAVVNIASTAAFTSGFAHAGYTASKGGIVSLTKMMCRELAQFGMRINAVAPGYIATEGMGLKGNKEAEDWLNFHCPMQRHGQPKEIGAVVAFLCSDEASFVNGVTIPVDGGYLSV